VGTRCANHVTPLYPQKVALTSPTGGGRSVGMVRSRTNATEFSLVLVCSSLQGFLYLEDGSKFTLSVCLFVCLFVCSILNDPVRN